MFIGGGQSENCDRYFDTFDISVPRFNLRISMFVYAAVVKCQSFIFLDIGFPMFETTLN